MNLLKRVRAKFAVITHGAYKKIRSAKSVVSFLNRASKAEFSRHPPVTTPLMDRIVSDLERDGISFTSLDDLFPGKDLGTTLRSYVDVPLKEASVGRKKKFLTYLWENKTVIDQRNPIVQVGVAPEILSIANTYLGLLSKFVFFSVNKTVVMDKNSQQAGSQRWHRDPASGDERILKVFMYLNDVDLMTGPFTYIKKSQRTGTWGKEFPAKQPDGYYPPEGAVERSPLSAGEIRCIGRAGTVIFCDTTGLHKGGYSMEKERIMATLLYVSPGSLQKQAFKKDTTVNTWIATLPEISRRALV